MDAWSDYVEWSGMDVSRLSRRPGDATVEHPATATPRASGALPARGGNGPRRAPGYHAHGPAARTLCRFRATG